MASSAGSLTDYRPSAFDRCTGPRIDLGGLGPQVQSRLGNGQNLPVTPDQLRSALGSDQVKQIAQHFGVDPEAALKVLAQHLPGVVDQASPNGTL